MFRITCCAALACTLFIPRLHALNETELWKLMNDHTCSVAAYPDDQPVPGKKLIRLEMQFARADWKQTAALPEGAIVERVELVSTLCAEDSAFNQEQLDRARLHALKLRAPSLFDDPRTEWSRVHVTSDKAKARDAFHGFIVTCRMPPTEASMKEELRLMKEAFYPSPSKAKADSAVYAFSEVPVLAITRGGADDFYTVSSTAVVKAGSMIHTPVFLSMSYTQDTVVTAVLQRNPWKDMLVVCDVTGSMSPYTTQLLAWYKLNTMSGRVNNFVFFNDGDNKPDGAKVAGATGGIYGITASQFDTVLSQAMFAMRRGYGGDCPENNVEALRYGLEKYGDAKEIVMIADNWATPRDLAFAGNIHRPVRIIVCGAFCGINPAYLDLARKTGGSVHTMEKDLTDLATLHDGETITIGPFKYKLEGGSFVQVSSL